MSATDLPPDPNHIEGAPHPRDTDKLFGHDDAISQFSDAYLQDRLHSGWMINGPRGVGKATLAWKIAGALLSDMGDALPVDLRLPADHPDRRLLDSGAHPRLFLLNRPFDIKTKVFKKDIPVDSVRAIRKFFSLSATDGGRRVVIVDAADDMNTNAANALLKELEEPPASTTLLLVTHRPLAVLPTIRSRCRQLRLEGLELPDFSAAMTQAGFEDVDLALLHQLTLGSPGRAIEMAIQDGDAIYNQIVRIFANQGGYNAHQANSLAASASGKTAAQRYRLITELLALFTARTARALADGQAIATSDVEASWHSHAQGNAQSWAQLQTELTSTARQAIAVNIDPQSVVLNLILRIKSVAFSGSQR